MSRPLLMLLLLAGILVAMAAAVAARGAPPAPPPAVTWTTPDPTLSTGAPRPVLSDMPADVAHLCGGTEISCVRVEVTGKGVADIGWGAYVTGYTPGIAGIPQPSSAQRKLPYRDGTVAYLRDPHTVLLHAHAANPHAKLTCRIWSDSGPTVTRTGNGSVTCTAYA